MVAGVGTEAGADTAGGRLRTRFFARVTERMAPRLLRLVAVAVVVLAALVHRAARAAVLQVPGLRGAVEAKADDENPGNGSRIAFARQAGQNG